MPPVEPPPNRWDLPDPFRADRDGVCGIGADLEPGTLLAAYRRGLFPMHLDRRGRHLGWWSPDPRGVIPLGGLRVSRSLRRACRDFEVTVDTDFDAVIRGCSEPRPSGGHWIHRSIVDAYTELHRLGWAHSVEVRERDGGAIVGGLYGVAVGGLFAGESMYHRRTDASKVALVGLVELLDPEGLLDVQWVTPHLASLGAVGIPMAEYQARLAAALARPLPGPFAGSIPSLDQLDEFER
jgi:leucyl/phenylalanyl-tRNA--protein transferase